MVIGATGTIGRATVRAFVERNYDVVCLIRARAGPRGTMDEFESAKLLSGATVRVGDPTNSASISRDFALETDRSKRFAL